MGARHLVWMIPYSVSNHCCFESSCVLFDEPVSEEEAMMHIDGRNRPEKKVDYRNLFEMFDTVPDDQESILQAMRKLYE